MTAPVLAARKICDVLDTLLFVAMHEMCPMRAVCFSCKPARKLQDWADKTDRDGPTLRSRLG